MRSRRDWAARFDVDHDPTHESPSLLLSRLSPLRLSILNRELMPPKLNTLRDTLAAVVAVLLDRLSAGATDSASLYGKSGVLPMARKIESMAWDAGDASPGTSAADPLFDRIADLLGISAWYAWSDVA
jgi:hypothetical protein